MSENGPQDHRTPAERLAEFRKNEMSGNKISDGEKPSPYHTYIGAKQKADGSWDLSKAAVWARTQEEDEALEDHYTSERQKETPAGREKRMELDSDIAAGKEAQRKANEILQAQTDENIKSGEDDPIKPLDVQARKEELAKMWEASEAKKKQDAATIETVYKSVGVESPTEREKARELAADIVLRDGGVKLVMAIPKYLSSEGFGGFQELKTRINDKFRIGGIDLITPDPRNQRRTVDSLIEQGIKEIIDIRHDVKPIYEDVRVPGQKGKAGILGFGKTEDIPDRIESRNTGRTEPRLHSEIVDGGKNEPAVRFTYTIPQELANQGVNHWKALGETRPGQSMNVLIVLPESSARQLEAILDKDPVAMRRIIERVMKEKLLQDPKAWDTPPAVGDQLRPPYERWDAEPNGGNMYVQKEGAKPGFQVESVRKVQK